MTDSQRTEFPAFTDRRKVGAGMQPTWRADGKELVFLAANGTDFMAADVKPGAAFEGGLPKQLFRVPTAAALSTTQRRYAMTNDGKRFLIRGVSSANTGIESLYVILNWPSLLAK